MKSPPGWMKVASAAMYADISRGTFRSWLKDGLPYVKIKGVILVKREWLDDWLSKFIVKNDPRLNVDKLVEEVMREIGK